MSLGEVVSSWREKLRRGLARAEGPATHGKARLEALDDAPLATPRVDVYENDEELLLYADVPGGGPSDAVVAWDERQGLRMFVTNHTLPQGEVWVGEYQPFDWFRAFQLPPGADGTRATSTLKDGVLTVHVPKQPAASRLIRVQAAD